ncbi:hypothetical protein [Pleomorphomonas sp. PLEO]|uniref:hypothetical protein n=1 Tax=Pleomorphomonas sp. PLEO TaxID=3239306 RepID=UPI00351ED256
MLGNFLCTDREIRLRHGVYLTPDLPIDHAEAERAGAVFKKIRLLDVPSTLSMAKAVSELFHDIVGAIFGSEDEDGAWRVRNVFTLVLKRGVKVIGSFWPESRLRVIRSPVDRAMCFLAGARFMLLLFFIVQPEWYLRLRDGGGPLSQWGYGVVL